MHSLPDVAFPIQYDNPEIGFSYKLHTDCRICGTKLGKPYLDLGEQPLANSLRSPLDVSPEFTAPLAVVLCENCGLSQLTIVVDPAVLYKGYRFRSGVSEAWVGHCRKLAEQSGTPGRVLDIAANDGACLQEFKNKGWDVLGVDPSPCAPDHIPMVKALWPYLPHTIGTFDLVVAQNVLGHVDDPIGFLRAAKNVLKANGQIVVEVPNVGDLIDNMAFDTIYHEHVSYWSGRAMEKASYRAGLSIENWERFPDLHGGTVRYWMEPDQ